MKILYAGDAAAKIGPIFVASPFNVEVKGFSTHIWGQPLIDALEEGEIEVLHMTSDVAISDFPRTIEDQPVESYPGIHPKWRRSADGGRVDILQRSFRAWRLL